MRHISKALTILCSQCEDILCDDVKKRSNHHKILGPLLKKLSKLDFLAFSTCLGQFFLKVIKVVVIIGEELDVGHVVTNLACSTYSFGRVFLEGSLLDLYLTIR